MVANAKNEEGRQRMVYCEIKETPMGNHKNKPTYYRSMMIRNIPLTHYPLPSRKNA